MKWIKQNYKVLLIWLVLLAIAPLFVEIIMVANIMGAEVAFGFLLLVVNDIYDNWRYRVQRITAFFIAVINIIKNHPIFQTHIYFTHVTLSLVVLFFSGSMAYSVLLWYPLVLSSHHLS